MLEKIFKISNENYANNPMRFGFYTNKDHAFTLAEVLITLGIIGVVAAMTMPTLLNSTNGKELEAGFQKAYSSISQAGIAVKEIRGPGMLRRYATYNGSVYPNASEIKNDFLAQMKRVGTCNYKTGSVRNYSKSTNSPYVDNGTPYPPVALANGMCMDVGVNSSRINITVDVNGTKRPNVMGYDIFFFEVDGNDNITPKMTSKAYTEDELAAIYPDEDQYNLHSQAGYPCSKKSNQRGNGLGCAGYAARNVCPDDSTKTYWECLK